MPVEARYSESLHDFRVAVRKLYGALYYLRGILGQKKTRKLRRKLRTYLTFTNKLRDHQVMGEWGAKLRISEVSILQMTPEQVLAHEKVLVQSLQSLQFKELLGDIHYLLVSQLSDVDKRQIKKEIMKNFKHTERRLKKFLNKWRQNPRDVKAAHRTRLLAKKLRYGVEAFEVALPHRAVKEGDFAKRLQNILGTIHDLSVLQSRLASKKAMTFLAIDG